MNACITRIAFLLFEAELYLYATGLEPHRSPSASPAKVETNCHVRSARSETPQALHTTGVFTSQRVPPPRRSAVGHVFVRLLGRARGKRSVHVPVPTPSLGLSAKPSGSGQTSWEIPLHWSTAGPSPQ